jgi:hypothetical protein
MTINIFCTLHVFVFKLLWFCFVLYVLCLDLDLNVFSLFIFIVLMFITSVLLNVKLDHTSHTKKQIFELAIVFHANNTTTK